jgi:glycosyltransferase involved in cell wall biosynthesis
MLNNTERPRVLGLLVGNIDARGSGAWVKYGQLFAALRAQTNLVAVRDVELYGFDRYQNALRSLRPSKQRWREAMHKNLWGFEQRSKLARAELARYANQVDVVLQHGAIFHAHTPDGPPVVIYTDFTYRLAQREDDWRNPFASAAESERWNNLEHEAYHHATMVLTRSDYTRQSLLDDYGMPPERVVTVGGGVNFEQLPPAASLHPTPRVLFIGKDFERKGGDLLLAAFARAREHVPNAELWLVTSKEDVSGPGVRRIAPTYDRAAIAALYHDSSVFAMPSRCETWGDVFLEAMAYGLPCIGANRDAMPEIIQHGETGFVVEPDDVESLAHYLKLLLSNGGERQRMGAGGFQRVNESFTWPAVVQRMLPLLVQAHIRQPAAVQASRLDHKVSAVGINHRNERHV